jgi:hypothetical protein
MDPELVVFALLDFDGVDFLGLGQHGGPVLLLARLLHRIHRLFELLGQFGLGTTATGLGLRQRRAGRSQKAERGNRRREFHPVWHFRCSLQRSRGFLDRGSVRYNLPSQGI